MLDIHDNAKRNFDDKGNELLTFVEEAPPEQSGPRFSPDLYVKHHFTAKDIISFRPVRLVDGFGEEHGFFFVQDRKKYGVFGKNYKSLLKLVESIARIPSVNGKISKVTIKELLFEWIHKKSNRLITKTLSEYVVDEAQKKIVSQEVWVPIKFLHAQGAFTVGRITFKPITKAILDELERQLAADSPDNKEKKLELFERDIRELQGNTAATLCIEADRTRAEEMALEETKKSLLILKLFSAAAIHPKLISIYDIWGSENIDRAKLLFLEDGKLACLNDQLLDTIQAETMDHKCIKMHMEAGLSIVSDLLVNSSKNAFQKAALDALFIYARCASAKDPADKLLYILVALENMFLRNNTEPIQQNLAERMAFLIEKDIQGRRNVIKDVRNAYAIRSSFVHHGASIEDYEALARFMWHAWRAITVIISSTKSVKTKDELLDHLDELKLS